MPAPSHSAGEIASGASEPEEVQFRFHRGDLARPTLVYLPGLHGDWTLLAPFRAALSDRASLVEFAYPRRTDWTLRDYASAVETVLSSQGIIRAWLLGESFSSQVAWQLLANQQARQAANGPKLEGLILVGGFVRHPWPWGVRLAYQASRAVPMWLLRGACRLYGTMAARKACDCPGLATDLQEFVARRTNEADRAAITSRYQTIADNDVRSIARECRLPVFQLSGEFDPIVPWWQVRPWLRRHCPGYRASRIIARADHNVLLSAPHESARQILDWIGGQGDAGATA